MGINNLFISEKAKTALTEIQKHLIADFEIEELIVFGVGVKEAAVGDGNPDLLVITKEQVNFNDKQGIKDFVTRINDVYGTNFKLMIFDRATWEAWSGQSLYQEVSREGMAIW